MKKTILLFIGLLLSTNVFANQGPRLTFSKVELCDSGYCDSVMCEVSMIDSRNIKRSKSYTEMDKHQPRICELLKAGETIVMKHLRKSNLCLQDEEKSDFTLNHIELEDCEFYRYGR